MEKRPNLQTITTKESLRDPSSIQHSQSLLRGSVSMLRRYRTPCGSREGVILYKVCLLLLLLIHTSQEENSSLERVRDGAGTGPLGVAGAPVLGLVGRERMSLHVRAFQIWRSPCAQLLPWW